jgi:hypothetical protein
MDHVNIRWVSSWPARVRAAVLQVSASRREAPYLRIPDFLSSGESDLILQVLLAQRGEFRARGISSSGSPVFYRMQAPLAPSAEFLARFVEVVPLLWHRFGVDLRDARLELLGQAYNDGSFFGRHSDADAGGPNWQRRLSGIYYLHTQPRRFEGGRLAVYGRSGRPYLVDPEHNSAVFFPRDAVHEVLPVRCPSKAFEDSRFAINVWIG